MWDEGDFSEFTIPILSIMNTDKEEIRNKMGGEGLDMSLEKLITKQLRDEENEGWWPKKREWDRFTNYSIN